MFGLRVPVSTISICSVVAGTGLLLSSNACSLAFNAKADQCETTADCTARGPAFVNTVCGDDHVCNINALKSCNSNKQCVDAFHGEPYFCRKTDSTCTKLLSVDCTSILADQGDIENDNAVFLGLIAPLSGTDQLTGIGMKNGVELARTDIKQSISDLPPASPGGPRRPVVWIACDEYRDLKNTAFVDAAKHLIEEVHVPTLLDGLISGDGIQILQKVGIPDNTIIFSSGNVGGTFTTLPKSGKNGELLYFRTSPSSADVGKIFATKLFPDIEKIVKGPAPQGRVPTGEDLKVMMVNKGDAFGQGFAQIVLANLGFNGGDVQSQVAAGNLSQHDYGNNVSLTDPTATAAYAAAAADILKKTPEVIIVSGAVETIPIMKTVESQWTEARFRPLWIELAGSIYTQDLLDYVGTNSDLRQRILGIQYNPSPKNTVYTDFKLRYGAKFSSGDPTKDGQFGFFSASSYDAAYAISLAIVAIGNNPIDAQSLSKAIGKLIPASGGPVVTLDPPDLSAAMSAAQGQGVDISGASGPLDFNLQTGDILDDVQMWCIVPDTSGKAKSFNLQSGSYYDSATGKNVTPDAATIAAAKAGTFGGFSCFDLKTATTQPDGGAP